MTKSPSQYELQGAFWLLRDWLKHAPKNALQSEFIVQRTTDLIKRVEKILREDFAKEPPVFKPHHSFGDLMTVEDWLGCVADGSFIDYDGHGDLGTATGLSQYSISPSDITVLKVKIPDWATHVMWYNK